MHTVKFITIAYKLIYSRTRFNTVTSLNKFIITIKNAVAE
jgi:hypothetical protein